MSQQVIVFRNAWMSETAVASTKDPGPSHVCEPNARDELCTYITECAVLQRWRAEQAAAAAGKAA